MGPDITGDDLRQYRRRLGLTQTEFAKRAGIPQQTFSNLETGRIPITADRIAQFRDAFDDAEPSFAEFLKEVAATAQHRSPALESPLARQLVVTVWRFSEFRFDRALPAGAAVGFVMVPFTDRPVVAVQMESATELWADGEILVFEQCRAEEIGEGQLCLAGVEQGSQRGGSASAVHIGKLLVARGTQRGRAGLALAEPGGRLIELADSDVRQFTRLVGRVRHVCP